MFPAPRPSVTTELIERAIREWAKAHHRGEEEVADVIRCYSRRIDGYELAKELERVAYWDIAVSDVEELDMVDNFVDDAVTQACWDWVKEHNIQPPLAVGARVQTYRGTGVIAAIDSRSPASYLVKLDGCADPTRHAVIAFEKAQPQGVPA